MRHFFAVSAAAVPLLGALAVALLNGCGAANAAAVSVNLVGIVNGNYSMHAIRPQHINVGIPYNDSGSSTPNGAHFTWTVDGLQVTAMVDGAPAFLDSVPGTISKDNRGLILFQFPGSVNYIFKKEGNSALRVGTTNKEIPGNPPARISNNMFGRRYVAGSTNSNFVSGRSPVREKVSDRAFTVTSRNFDSTTNNAVQTFLTSGESNERCDWVANDVNNPNSLWAIDGNGQNASGDIIVFRFQTAAFTWVGQVNAAGGTVTRGTFMNDAGTVFGEWTATISGTGNGLGKPTANN